MENTELIDKIRSIIKETRGTCWCGRGECCEICSDGSNYSRLVIALDSFCNETDGIKKEKYRLSDYFDIVVLRYRL